jgi:hypothetical protein
MQQEQISEGFDAGLNPPGTLWRMGGDVIEDRPELTKSRKGVAEPHRPCLAHTARTSSSLANSPRGSGGFRSGDNGLLFGRERCWRFIIGAGEAENNTRDIVLCLRRERSKTNPCTTRRKL